MYQQSDSDSTDSDEGIRFKTDSIRNKQGNFDSSYKRSKSRSKSPNGRKDKYREKPKRRRRSSEEESRRRRRDREERRRSPEEKKNEANKNNVLGPALPPHLLKKKEAIVGPALPPHLLNKSVDNNVIGPALPPKLTKKEAIEGPALPPHLINKPVENNVIGPSLPSELTKKEDDEPEERCIGPTLPPHLREQLLKESPEYIIQDSVDSDEDEDVHGPLPMDSMKYSKAHVALEERALQMKLDKFNDTGIKEPVREEWMLELPEVNASRLGLGPRQFRSKAGPDFSDRSSWTDTPESKKKKKDKKEVDIRKEAEIKEMLARDKEQEALSKKHKKGKESLVEQHQKKLKNEKKGGTSGERRPFNRDTDLQVNRFDEAQKKAVLKKAQLLDDRFSSGQSKFL